MKKDVTYGKEDLETLLAYNLKLFTDAADLIRKGYFAINPYTADGRSVQGDQIKAITHFEADRHMGQARKLLKLPSKGKKEALLEMMSAEMSAKEGLIAEKAAPFLRQSQSQAVEEEEETDVN